MKKLIIILTITLILTGCASVDTNESKYEYVDLWGNKGTSSDCFMGHNLYCKIGEPGLIQVSQFKKLESK